jgi:hypothetical protein
VPYGKRTYLDLLVDRRSELGIDSGFLAICEPMADAAPAESNPARERILACHRRFAWAGLHGQVFDAAVCLYLRVPFASDDVDAPSI